jgi:excisionase family DNA binding protein
MDNIFTPKELCTFLKISQRTLYRMLSKGQLPFAIKIDGSWRFLEKDVVEYLEKSKIHIKVLKVLNDCIQEIK